MAQLITADYPSTIAELYAILRLAVKNYKQNLAKFTALKPKYTLAYGDAILTAIDAAEALPSKEERDMDSETFRGQLITLNKNCLDKWNVMESYIKEVYKGSDLKPALQAAGSIEYDKASNKNWEYTIAMNKAAIKFMAVPANLTKLLDGGNNMPAGFPAAYAVDATAFFTKHGEFVAASETTTATDAKTKANNVVYATTMDLMSDGKMLGQNDAAFAKLFTWTDLKTIISPPGSASLDFEALDKLSLAAVTGVTVMMQSVGGTQINLSLDANGLGNTGTLDPAVYKGIAKAPNYLDLPFIKEVNKGTGAALKLLMVKI